MRNNGDVKSRKQYRRIIIICIFITLSIFVPALAETDGGGRTRTSNCEHIPPGDIHGGKVKNVENKLIHIFRGETNLIKAAFSEEDVDVVIGHGLKIDNNEFDRSLFNRVVSPIQVSHESKITDLSKNDLKGILSGQIYNWGEINQEQDQDITIYLHGGELQRRSFNGMLQDLGVKDISKLKNVKLLPNYHSLKEAASKDIGSIVLGIRDFETKKLKAISIDGNPCTVKYDFNTITQSPTILEQETLNYPLTEDIYLYKKKDSETSIPIAKTFQNIILKTE